LRYSERDRRRDYRQGRADGRQGSPLYHGCPRSARTPRTSQYLFLARNQELAALYELCQQEQNQLLVTLREADSNRQQLVEEQDATRVKRKAYASRTLWPVTSHKPRLIMARPTDDACRNSWDRNPITKQPSSMPRSALKRLYATCDLAGRRSRGWIQYPPSERWPSTEAGHIRAHQREKCPKSTRDVKISVKQVSAQIRKLALVRNMSAQDPACRPT
jgi:hypothetical protein